MNELSCRVIYAIIEGKDNDAGFFIRQRLNCGPELLKGCSTLVFVWFAGVTHGRGKPVSHAILSRRADASV